jgi:putative peptidoglycan lipid II flippase
MVKSVKYNILRASIAVSAATIILKILGLFREIVLAAIYGAGTVSDAFVIAMTIPSIVLLVISSAVTATYIPQYASHGGDKNLFTSNLLTLLFFVGFIFAFIFALYPQILVYLFASKIAPDTFETASKFLRLMVWSAIPLLLIGIFRAYLQIKKIFFIAIVSDTLINISIICSIIMSKLTGILILLGVGSVIGNFMSMVVLIIFCRKNGFQYHPRLGVHDEHIRKMFKLMLPIILSSAVLEVNQIVDKNLASSLISGTVSTLNYSVKVNNVVTALVGTAVMTALFPKMSELAAKNDIHELKKHLIDCVVTLLPLLLPLTVGMVMLSRPLVQILLERGAFEPEDTQRTAECLQMYALSIATSNLTPLFVRAFYAMKQAKFPAILSAISVATGIVLKFLLVDSYQHRGLAFGTSMVNILYATLLLIIFRRKVGVLGLRQQGTEFLKIIIATTVMGIFVWLAILNTSILSGNYFQSLLWLAIIVSISVVLYGGLLMVLKVKVATSIVSKLRKREKQDEN